MFRELQVAAHVSGMRQRVRRGLIEGPVEAERQETLDLKDSMLWALPGSWNFALSGLGVHEE